MIPRDFKKVPKSLKPPATRRFCLCCEAITRFEFDRGTHHSLCIECGGWMSSKEELSNGEIKKINAEGYMLRKVN